MSIETFKRPARRRHPLALLFTQLCSITTHAFSFLTKQLRSPNPLHPSQFDLTAEHLTGKHSTASPFVSHDTTCPFTGGPLARSLLAVFTLVCTPSVAAEPRFVATGAEFAAQLPTFRLHTSAGGVTAAHGEESLFITLTSWGRVGLTHSVQRAEPRLQPCFSAPCGGAVFWSHGAITERWEVGVRGAEQSWSLSSRPPGPGPLGLHLTVSAALVEVTSDGRSAKFHTDSGITWSYLNLKTTDSTGAELRAWFTATADGLAITINDEAAVYPLFIDPTLTLDEQLVASDISLSGFFGKSVSGAGDVNGDGYDDVVIGAPAVDTYSGAAYVYLGGPNGLNQPSERRLQEPSPVFFHYFGEVVSGVGDLNGDGFSDVIVSSTEDDSGRAFLFSGGSTGVSVSPSPVLQPSTIEPKNEFGAAISGLGDVNGDGYDDLLIGDPSDPTAGVNAGAVYLYFGGPSALGLPTQIPGPRFGSRFGVSVSGAGDVNGDGYNDAIIGASADDEGGVDSGAAFLLFGSPSGLGPPVKLTLATPTPGDLFGASVSTAGDLNQDGYDDLIIGAPGADGVGDQSGAAYLFYGAATGVNPYLITELRPDDPQVASQFGSAVTGGVDFNQDGLPDVLIGAKDHNVFGSKSGSAYFAFSPSQMQDLLVLSPTIPETGLVFDQFGYAVSVAGDINGDGFGDAVIGAYNTDGVSFNNGAAYLVYGDCTESWFEDRDGDQFGDDAALVLACAPPVGFVANAGDCDDNRADVNPAQEEVCDDDLIDEDCSGSAIAPSIWHKDNDEDGFGGSQSLASCLRPGGYVDNDGDCDDRKPQVHFAAIEVCDGLDNNCNTLVDDQDPTLADANLWYVDSDHDGFGDINTLIRSCAQPPNAVNNPQDCDDLQPQVHPNAIERCDDHQADEDCSGTADDQDPNTTGKTTWYPDRDHDGYGDPNSPTPSCLRPTEHTLNHSDCDDHNPKTFPGAPQVPGHQYNDCKGEAQPPKQGCSCTTQTSLPTPLLLLTLLTTLLIQRRKHSIP